MEFNNVGYVIVDDKEFYYDTEFCEGFGPLHRAKIFGNEDLCMALSRLKDQKSQRPSANVMKVVSIVLTDANGDIEILIEEERQKAMQNAVQSVNQKYGID